MGLPYIYCMQVKASVVEQNIVVDAIDMFRYTVKRIWYIRYE